jgi:ParB-like chromosome segregation protein Spo0J
MTTEQPATLVPIPSVYLPMAEIQPSPTNPRNRFDPKLMEELIASVRAHGILQPILVRPLEKFCRAHGWFPGTYYSADVCGG